MRDDLKPESELALRIEEELVHSVERNWSTAGIALLGGLLGIPFTKGGSVFLATAYLVQQEMVEGKKAAREGAAQRERLVKALEVEAARR